MGLANSPGRRDVKVHNLPMVVSGARVYLLVYFHVILAHAVFIFHKFFCGVLFTILENKNFTA